MVLMCCNVWAQCPTGDVQLSSQQQVDDFAVQYPNCTEISGHLILATSPNHNTNIDNLQGLENLSSIEGNLHIGSYQPSVITTYAWDVEGGYFGGHPDLTNLSGLENLQTIGGDLLISNNYKLTSISALSGLDSIGGNISLYKNHILTSLDGLANLTTIHGDLAIGNLESFCLSTFCQE